MLITSSVYLIIPQTKPDNFIEKMLVINKIQFLIDLQHTYSQNFWRDHLSSAISCHEQPCPGPTECFSMQVDPSSATSCLTQPATGKFSTQIIIFTDINHGCRIYAGLHFKRKV